MTNSAKKIKIKNFDTMMTSKTIDMLKFIKQNNKDAKLYFIMGSDNLRIT